MRQAVRLSMAKCRATSQVSLQTPTINYGEWQGGKLKRSGAHIQKASLGRYTSMACQSKGLEGGRRRACTVCPTQTTGVYAYCFKSTPTTQMRLALITLVFFTKIYLCACACVRACVYVWVHTMCTQCPWRPEGGIGSSETEVTTSVRGSMRVLRTKLGWGRGVVLCKSNQCP